MVDSGMQVCVRHLVTNSYLMIVARHPDVASRGAYLGRHPKPTLFFSHEGVHRVLTLLCESELASMIQCLHPCNGKADRLIFKHKKPSSLSDCFRITKGTFLRKIGQLPGLPRNDRGVKMGHK